MVPSPELHLDIQLCRHGARLEVETKPHEGAPTVYRLIDPHSGVPIMQGLTFTVSDGPEPFFRREPGSDCFA